MMSLSIILPIYNEENILKKNIPILYKSLKDDFEILLCDNGSTDNTKSICQDLIKKYPKIRYLFVKEKGIGNGIRVGIENAKKKYIMFYAIDLPFGTKIIDESIAKMKDYDIVIGSKGHKDSINNHTFQRKIFSFFFNSFVNILFGLHIRDTQGSLMFKKDHIIKYLNHLDASDAFFETQILIYGKRNKDKIIEIPVTYKQQRKGSKINPIKDGLKILRQIIHERLK